MGVEEEPAQDDDPDYVDIVVWNSPKQGGQCNCEAGQEYNGGNWLWHCFWLATALGCIYINIKFRV